MTQTGQPATCTADDGNLYPNFLLGFPTATAKVPHRHELVRSTSVYLFAQDSWKIRPNLDAELRVAVGNEHAADGHWPESTDIPSGAGLHDLSLHASTSQPALRSDSWRMTAAIRRADSSRSGFSRGQRHSEWIDEHVLQGLCAAPGNQLEPGAQRRIPEARSPAGPTR